MSVLSGAAGDLAAFGGWHDGQLRHTQFFAEGMHCANCARKISEGLRAVPGVESADVSLAGNRVSLSWQPNRVSLNLLLDEVRRLGYQPVPLSGAQAAGAERLEARRMLKRLGLAALAMMQLMMYSVSLYAAARHGIEPWIEKLLRITTLLIATPVLFYSGAPFLQGAWRDLRRRSLGMDVPVALALLLAYAASVWNTLRGSGEIYFDSVVMFILFLLAGRYVEQRVRRGSLDAGEALARSLPVTVTRLGADGASERVAIAGVRKGDVLLVARGAVVPVDGELMEGAGEFDEALITGESRPVQVPAGGSVPSGAVNLGQPVRLRACAAAAGSTLASMLGLMDRAWKERPRTVHAADRAARQFVLWILVLAVLVAVGWSLVDPARAFPATLAVLVVTCPCALSLAMPAASAAAGTRLARAGVLVTRADALERLATVDTVVFDKTGTLTETRPRVSRVLALRGRPEAELLARAAALEQFSMHPLAEALRGTAPGTCTVQSAREDAGEGVEGLIAGERWRIGSRRFAAAGTADGPDVGNGVGADAGGTPAEPAASQGERSCWLGGPAGLEARLDFGEALRADAAAVAAGLHGRGLQLVIASGDDEAAVRHAADAAQADQFHAQLLPEDKLALVRALQNDGRHVLALGDGINDGPLLAAADASAAMGRGAALAHSAADLVLMNESLRGVELAIDTARSYLKVVRANLRWALIYNLVAVPLAAFGFAPPWLASLGMSASSLYVVLRARRLARVSP